MGRPAGWMKALTGRAAMRSPGKPALRRDVERLFWREIAKGLTSEDAAVAVGASQAVGSRWFRERGGMPSFMLGPAVGPLSVVRRAGGDRHAAERRAAGVREIARRLGRRSVDDLAGAAPQRGHPRGAARLSGIGRAVEGRTAGSRPKAAKLATHDAAARVRAGAAGRHGHRPDGTPVPGPRRRVGTAGNTARRQDRRWATSWSPEQISNRLRVDFPDDESMRISHEAIYQALYVQGRGALRRELVACLRTGRALRVPRARTRQRRGKQFVTPRGDDQRTTRRGRRPRGARALGGRSDHRTRPLGDRHPRRAHHPVHDAAAPAAHGRPRRADLE